MKKTSLEVSKSSIWKQKKNILNNTYYLQPKETAEINICITFV